MGIPIYVKNNMLGILCVISQITGFYNPAHLERLQMFSGHVGVAIENARLFSRVTELATIDELTKLNNRRNFLSLVTKEVIRSQRHQKDFSLIMVDIDHFKDINDVYGHPVGDLVLQKVAQIFHTAMREADIPGRYGGDEFCIALPETNEQDAFKVAERLSEKIYQVQIPAGDKVVNFTASMGVATLDKTNTTSFGDLLQKADQALYLAKQKGRHRVERSSEIAD
jgi:two-component system, cell cycle response regulator